MQISEGRFNTDPKPQYEQHLLPDEGDLRKILRYEAMLDRQFYRCLDQLVRLQERRRATVLRGAESADAPSPDNGRILDGTDLLTT